MRDFLRAKFVLFMTAGFFVFIGWAQTRSPLAVESRLTSIAPDGSSKRILYQAARHFEAPNWSPDGKWFIMNSGGRLYRLSVAGGEPEVINTGTVDRINNDHGIAPNGKLLVISAGPLYTLPFEGGTPNRITRLEPSYYHGWSPDGRTLVYCAPRGRNFDIYSIPIIGGEEKRLTSHTAYDDGPDYSPDGRWVYFNSNRAGTWDVWRIPATGAGPEDQLAERITRDEMEDWFPHPSPDGKWIVFLSYPPGTEGHPANKDVRLRIMSSAGGAIREIDRFTGGQGTINVNSWAPDSGRFAYITYRPRSENDPVRVKGQP